jgi:hypothetical protein
MLPGVGVAALTSELALPIAGDDDDREGLAWPPVQAVSNNIVITHREMTLIIGVLLGAELAEIRV